MVSLTHQIKHVTLNLSGKFAAPTQASGWPASPGSAAGTRQRKCCEAATRLACGAVWQCGSAAGTERLKRHMHSSSLKSSTGMYCVTEQVQRPAPQLDLPQASRGTAAEHGARHRRLQEGAACCMLVPVSTSTCITRSACLPAMVE
jgi:hypothetical protein